MLRTFQLTTANGLALVLRSDSPFTRRFSIYAGNDAVGTIRPDHLFTRSSHIDCDPVVPVHIQLLAFSLVLILWRRTQTNN